MVRGSDALVPAFLSLLKKAKPFFQEGWRLLNFAFSRASSWLLSKCPWIEIILLLSETWMKTFLMITTTLLLADYLVQLRNRLDVNTYYYAFSTIAQSLASAFAFLVAVALHRMRAIEDGLEVNLEEVIEHALHGQSVDLLRRKNRCHFWDDMERDIKDSHIVSIQDDAVSSHTWTSWKSFQLGKEALEALRLELVGTLRLTSLVIAFCVFSIPLSKLLNREPPCSWFWPVLSLLILFTVSFLSFKCLWLYQGHRIKIGGLGRMANSAFGGKLNPYGTCSHLFTMFVVYLVVDNKYNVYVR